MFMYTPIAAQLFGARAIRMSDIRIADDNLVTGVAQRDKHALETLYDRYASSALGLAMKIIGERNVAEEIVQEAFWRVWKRADTYQPGRGQFGAWLFGIIHNLAIDELRRRQVQPAATSLDLKDENAVDIPDSRIDVEEAVQQQITGAQVRAALTGLPEPQRRVIELAYFEGLTHQEIADKLGEPVGTIHTRSRLGLQKLRVQLLSLDLGKV
jgi:RNA polymerase sigma-70 factor, ECF subfamily